MRSVSQVRWQRRSEKVMRAICPSRSEPKLPTASVRSVPLSSGSPSESTAGSFGSTSQTWSTIMDSTSTSTSTALQAPFHVPFERHRKLLGSKSAPPGLEMFLIRDNDNISGPPHRQVRTWFGTWVYSCRFNFLHQPIPCVRAERMVLPHVVGGAPVSPAL